MALLGTPQISTGFSPHDKIRSLSVDFDAKWESAGLLREAFRPGFWGVPNKYSGDYRRGCVLVEWRTPPRGANCLWGVPNRRLADYRWGAVLAERRDPPGGTCRVRSTKTPKQLRGPQPSIYSWRIAPLHQNTSPAIIDGVFVGYPPETRAEGLTKEARTFPFRGEVHRYASNFVVGGKPR